MSHLRYMKFTRTFWPAALVGGLLLVFEQPAHAYIDPGTGSLIYQVLLAGLLGLVFTFRRTLETIVVFFRGLFGKRDVGSEGKPAE